MPNELQTQSPNIPKLVRILVNLFNRGYIKHSGMSFSPRVCFYTASRHLFEAFRLNAEVAEPELHSYLFQPLLSGSYPIFLAEDIPTQSTKSLRPHRKGIPHPGRQKGSQTITLAVSIALPPPKPITSSVPSWRTTLVPSSTVEA